MFKQNMYDWILHHWQVVQLPISNYCTKVPINGHTKNQFPQAVIESVYQRTSQQHGELTKKGGLKEAQEKPNNIIISEYMIRHTFPPWLNNMSSHHKVMCGYYCCISSNFIYLSLLIWIDFHLKKLKYHILYSQNIMWGKMTSRIYATYNNYVIPHGNHVYKTTTNLFMATMYTFESEKNDLCHCNCVF